MIVSAPLPPPPPIDCATTPPAFLPAVETSPVTLAFTVPAAPPEPTEPPTPTATAPLPLHAPDALASTSNPPLPPPPPIDWTTTPRDSLAAVVTLPFDVSDTFDALPPPPADPP